MPLERAWLTEDHWHVQPIDTGTKWRINCSELFDGCLFLHWKEIIRNCCDSFCQPCKGGPYFHGKCSYFPNNVCLSLKAPAFYKGIGAFIVPRNNIFLFCVTNNCTYASASAKCVSIKPNGPVGSCGFMNCYGYSPYLELVAVDAPR